MSIDNRSDDQAPEKLRAALREQLKDQVFIPPQVDAAVLGRAREHLRRARPAVWFRRVWAPALAAAACLMLGAWLTYHLTGPERAPASLAQMDLDRSGQVDILDAFTLALHLQQGARTNPRTDFNSDGVVDEKDIDVIANAVVRLEAGS